jgi:hypothetical protein
MSKSNSSKAANVQTSSKAAKDRKAVTTTAVVLPSGASVDISDAVIAAEGKRLAVTQFRTSAHPIAQATRKAARAAGVERALDRLAVKSDSRVLHATVTAKYTAMLAECQLLTANPDLQGVASTLAKLRKGPTAPKAATVAPSNGATATPTAPEALTVEAPTN